MTETLARGSDGSPRVRKAKRDGWTGVKARTFLDHLRISCNVAASCRKAGVGETAVYNRRSFLQQTVNVRDWAASRQSI